MLLPPMPPLVLQRVLRAPRPPTLRRGELARVPPALQQLTLRRGEASSVNSALVVHPQALLQQATVPRVRGRVRSSEVAKTMPTPQVAVPEPQMVPAVALEPRARQVPVARAVVLDSPVVAPEYPERQARLLPAVALEPPVVLLEAQVPHFPAVPGVALESPVVDLVVRAGGAPEFRAAGAPESPVAVALPLAHLGALLIREVGLVGLAVRCAAEAQEPPVEELQELREAGAQELPVVPEQPVVPESPGVPESPVTRAAREGQGGERADKVPPQT